MFKKFRSIGPGALVTAAFIGPGTVTTCSLAGAGYGYALLWALLFSVIATIILQEMAARLGIIGQKSLGQAIRIQFPKGLSRLLSILLVLSAILLGNAAYETGNLLGAALGIDAIPAVKDFLPDGIRIWGPIIGIVAFIILWLGNYKILERILIGLVILMSLVFLTTMVVILPDLSEILRGLILPSIPKGSALTVAALVGTTVVPYNLFLHASTVQEKWKNPEDLKAARTDLLLSVILGGIVSMAIVITSSAAFFNTQTAITSGADLAVQLEPILGNWASAFIGIGLFAAGLTSAITAPMAAAYATTGIMGWKKDIKSRSFRLVWISILLIGIILSALGLKPLPAIVFAQAANGILLPVIAIYLLKTMNDQKLLGKHRNKPIMNLLGILVVVITLLLGLRSLASVVGLI